MSRRADLKRNPAAHLTTASTVAAALASDPDSARTVILPEWPRFARTMFGLRGRF
jgi:hypothetical protein